MVWILGAGFSRPLGGPLLDDLMSRQAVRDFRHWPDFHETKTPEGFDKIDCAAAVQKIYAIGCKQRPSRLWLNAEEFLERLELACRTETNLWSARIQELGSEVPVTSGDVTADLVRSIEVLRREALRFIAGACSYFTRDLGGIASLETWQPYLRWAASLKPQDSIITFNYDDVLDRMNPQLKRRLRWAIPLTRDGGAYEFGDPHGPVVHHLHGHVGWRELPDGRVEHGVPTAHLDPSNAILGIPGPGKKELAEGRLGELWNRSLQAIQNADVVVFVGYRFPETDNMSKCRILDALRQKGSAVVHLVLGPNNPDTPRVKGMIAWTRTRDDNPVRVQEMWAQDFFSAFERIRL